MNPTHALTSEWTIAQTRRYACAGSNRESDVTRPQGSGLPKGRRFEMMIFSCLCNFRELRRTLQVCNCTLRSHLVYELTGESGFPQGLKPAFFAGLGGMAEAMPFPQST